MVAKDYLVAGKAPCEGGRTGLLVTARTLGDDQSV